jgi:hypothetical protein
VASRRSCAWTTQVAGAREIAQPSQKEFTQSFSLDPMKPGPGTATGRLAGFESGSRVSVRWTYENSIQRWQGGQMTLDGPTKSLFDGGDIPYIWTGKLQLETAWTVP